MKSIKSLLILSTLLIFGFGVDALAQETDGTEPEVEEVEAGLAEGDFFYFLDTALERLDLAFTFNAERKIEKAFAHMQERLAEAELRAEEGKKDLSEKIMARYEKKAQFIIDRAENLDAEEKVKDVFARLEERTERHMEKLEAVLERVPEEAKGAIEKVIENLEERAEEKQQKLEDVQARVKEKLEKRKGDGGDESDEELDDEEDEEDLDDEDGEDVDLDEDGNGSEDDSEEEEDEVEEEDDDENEEEDADGLGLGKEKSNGKNKNS